MFFLRQFDFDRAALLLEFGQADGVARASFSSRVGISASWVCFCASEFGRLGVDLFALMLKRFDLRCADSWISGSACSLRLTKEAHSARRCSMNWLSSRMRCSSSLLLLAKEAQICSSVARATLLSVKRGIGRVALLAQELPVQRSARSPAPGESVRALPVRPRWLHSSARFCKPSCFLRGEALDFVNDRIDFLMQQALRILQAR